MTYLYTICFAFGFFECQQMLWGIIKPMILKPLSEITSETEKELASYSQLTQRLLVNRGITSRDGAYNFLFPSYEDHSHDPFLLKDMERAIDRIHSAIQNSEKIGVYADYDCDGIPGAVVMSDFFDLVGYKNYTVYIPDRHKEGYGLQIPAIDSLIEQGIDLFVTVDLGITNNKEVEYITAQGREIIVTDHHLVGESVPKAFAVVNPKQDDCNYPDPMLCGSGVAYKLVQAFIKKYGEVYRVNPGQEKWMLDMVGLATLSDMVPLVNENRVLARYGMLVFKKTKRKGLLHLIKKAGVNLNVLVEDDITFMISPRINAAGRMDHPRHAYELLSTKDNNVALEKSNLLHQYNLTRKNLVKQIMKSAKSTLSKRNVGKVIVVGSRDWAIGVLGLVASRLVEEYKVPVFVWGGDEETELLKGSCRGDGSVNVVNLMRENESLFENFGGHEAAGGFSIQVASVHKLQDALGDSYNNHKIEQPFKEMYEYETELGMNDVNESVYGEVSKLAPFGVGNPKPVFLFRDSVVQGVRVFGKQNEHLELIFQDSIGRGVKAIAFFTKFNAFGDVLEVGKKIHLFASIEKSTFGYKSEIQLRIKDIHFCY